MMYVTATGIVLAAGGVREYDRLVTLYTRELGKVRVLFRGARRPHAKLLALTQPAVEIEVQLYRGRAPGGDRTARAAGARMLDQFMSARGTLDSYLFTCAVLELTDCLTLEHLPDPRKYLLLRRALEQAGDIACREKVLLAFTLRLVKLCGYLPELAACVACRRPHDGSDWHFAPGAGGIVCPACAGTVTGWVRGVSGAAVHLLRKFCTLSADAVDVLDADAVRVHEARRIVHAHLRQYLHRPLKTIPVENT
jgi:DNA repair protein RecO (recombination protein O)